VTAVDDRKIPRGIATPAGGSVVVHFDGACQPPRGGGLAGYGFTVDGGGFLHEDHGLATRPYSERATNNVAEYVGAIRALEWLAEQGYRGEVELRGDSQLVIRQSRGEYAVRAEHLRAYAERLRQLAAGFARVTYVWVPREQNVRADALSKLALEEAGPSARPYRRRGAGPVETEDPTSGA